ncbi:hypothetical protein GCM10009756_12170 [Pseudokineococcus marinus]
MDAAARDRLLEQLGRETYVSLATRRRDGTERATPVWVVRDGDVLLVTTGATTAKVRRARRDPAATLTSCDARGRVRPGAPTTPVVVEVTDAPAAVARVDQLLRRKHPVGHRALAVAHAAARLRSRLPGGGGEGGLADDQVVLRLRLRDA